MGVVRQAAARGELLEELQRRRVLLGESGELGRIAGREREELRDVHADDALGVVAPDLGRDHRAAVVAVRAVAFVAQARHRLHPRARDARHVPPGRGRRAREPGARHRGDDEVQGVRGVIGVDFTVIDPPELAAQVRELAERFARAAASGAVDGRQ
jgi:hypothetical protein